MNKSNTIKQLAEALAAAQAEMPVVRMNAQNPFLKNKYADLGAVIETSRPVLQRHGLSVSQFPTSEGDRIGVTSILMHSSGEWLEDTIYLPSGDTNKAQSVAQSAGSVISYLRRYSLASILGLYADEDTDGHSTNGHKPEAKKEAEKPADAAVTDAMWNTWTKLTDKADVLHIKHPTLDRSKVKVEKLIELGKELRAHVEAAEAQSKAGA